MMRLLLAGYAALLWLAPVAPHHAGAADQRASVAADHHLSNAAARVAPQQQLAPHADEARERTPDQQSRGLVSPRPAPIVTRASAWHRCAIVVPPARTAGAHPFFDATAPPHA